MKRFLFLAVVAASCFPEPTSPDVEERTYAAPDCADYCDTMQELGCKEGEPNHNGDLCLEVCLDSQGGPEPVDMTAQSCAVAEE